MQKQPNKVEKKNGININDVILIESCYKRLVDEIKGEVTNDFKLDLEVVVANDSEFSVILKLLFEAKQNEQKILEANIIMKGVFFVCGEKPAYFNEFCYINAPAILYPYMREHLSSLTNKSGIPPVILPPFNFVAFGKDYLSKKKEEIAAKED